MGLQYNTKMPRAHLRYFFLTLAVAAVAAFAARAVVHGQDAGAFRSFLPASILPAIDRGLAADWSHAPGSPEAVVRESMRRSIVTLDRVSASGAHYVAGRVIVKFRDGTSSTSTSPSTSASSMAARVRAMATVSQTATVPERPSYANFDVVRIDPGEDPETVAAALRQRPDVEYAQPAYRIRPAFVPNDQYYKELQWNLPLIDLERAWDMQPAAGSNITVAVLDTGVSYTNATVRFHANAFRDDNGVLYPSLGDLTLNFVLAPELGPGSRFVAPRDFIWNDTVPLDLDGHGTHVSGTIGQLTNNSAGMAGVAFNVKIMPIKVIDGMWDDIFGSPSQGTDDVVARGIRYAADNGANVINMSIGREGPPAPVIEDAIKYAVGKGVFIAIAGGNSFEDGNPTEVLAEIASRVQGAVSVAAVDPAKQHARYSGTGSYIELSAPGGTDRGFGSNGYVWQQTYDFTLTDTFLLPPSRYGPPRFDVLAYIGYIGTSQATPHVAGLAAMLMQQGIKNPAAIEAALEKFATDLGDKGRDNTFGYGLIEARDTMRGLGLAK
jgi:subtilisin family serine protease